MRGLLLLFGIFLFITSSCKKDCENPLMVGAASSMQFAMDPICQEFERQTGVCCEIILSSSGKLTAQIVEGAPLDIFLSADLKYPEILFQQGLSQSSPVIYATGSLVLWKRRDQRPLTLDMLMDEDVKNIAIANPETAPYGRAAMEYLQKSRLSEAVGAKLVYGESISQANQFVMTGAADLGFTSKSVVLSLQQKTSIDWMELDSKSYEPISQGMVLITHGPNNSNAEQFMRFILSPTGKQILVESGYSIYENPRQD